MHQLLCMDTNIQAEVHFRKLKNTLLLRAYDTFAFEKTPYLLGGSDAIVIIQ